MNRNRAALTLVIVLSLLAFAGCGSSDDSTSSSDATDTTESTDTVSTAATEATTTDATTIDSSDSALRKSFTVGLKASLAGKGLPADYVDCVVTKADNSVSDSEIRTIGKQVQGGDSSAAENIGVDLGKQCVAEGAGIDEFRSKLVTSIRTSLKGSDLSKAYKDCVVKEADKQISDDELAAILVVAVDNPAVAQTKSQAIGRQLGQECLSQGIKP